MSNKRMEEVPLSLIRENKTALRKVDREGKAYQELFADIKKNGVEQNITVRECVDTVTGEKFYGLIDGLHRLTCAKDAGLASLFCYVIEASDFEVLQRQFVLNASRVETKPNEYTQQLTRMLAMNPTMTITELATLVSKSPETVNKYLGLLKLHKEVAAAVDEGKIVLANAFALSKLPLTEQINFVEQAMTEEAKVFVPNVNQRVEAIRKATREGKAAAPASFVAIAHARKLEELKKEAELCEAAAKLGITGDALVTWKLAIAWTLHMDPKSVAEASAAYETAEKEKKAKAEARKEKLAADKLAKEVAEKSNLDKQLGVK